TCVCFSVCASLLGACLPFPMIRRIPPDRFIMLSLCLLRLMVASVEVTNLGFSPYLLPCSVKNRTTAARQLQSLKWLIFRHRYLVGLRHPASDSESTANCQKRTITF